MACDHDAIRDIELRLVDFLQASQRINHITIDNVLVYLVE